MSSVTTKFYFPQGSFKPSISLDHPKSSQDISNSTYEQFDHSISERLKYSNSNKRGLRRSLSNNSQPKNVDKPLVTRLDRLASNLADYKILRLEYPQTIEKAEKLIEQLSSGALENNWCSQDPLVNITFENEIVLEWWNKSKKITIYVSEEAIDYIKVWGADMDDEMAEGSINLNDDLTDLSQWISS
jgi:hypothetical protein